MTTPQVVEMSVTVNNNPFREYTYLDNYIPGTNQVFFFGCFQSVGGLQIVDTISSRTYELDNLAQVFVYSSELSPFIHQSKRWPMWLNYNKQRLYKESIWSHNYGKYGNFCSSQDKETAQRRKEILMTKKTDVSGCLITFWPLTGLCFSCARCPLVPNFCCCQGTRKSEFLHTNNNYAEHQVLQGQNSELPSIFLRA